jgi:hypothetical protein
LEQAQQVAKMQYDRQHRNVSFTVGEWAWLRLHHRPHGSLAASSTGKLRQRYFGPYQIVEAINPVAFRLALPQGARLHDVFHVGLLKKFVGTPPSTPPLLPQVHHGAIVPVPACVLRLRLFDDVRQALVQWEGQPPSATSWEDLEQFKERYPQFQLVDELLLKGGSDVMWGKKYSRRKRKRPTQPAPSTTSGYD